jgi:hypothetical protein
MWSDAYRSLTLADHKSGLGPDDLERLVEHTSTRPGMPDARHERSFEDADGALHFRIAIELEPRGAYDRVVVRWGLVRAVRRTLANLDAAFRDRQAVR